MSNHSSIATAEQSASSLATPIEEKFWKRYSPHHELPLSSVSSVAVHVLGIVAVIAFAVLPGEWSSRDSGGGLPVSSLNDPSDEPAKPPETPPAAGPIQSRVDVGPGVPGQLENPVDPVRPERLDVRSGAPPIPLPSLSPASNDRLINAAREASSLLGEVSDRMGVVNAPVPSPRSTDSSLGRPGGTGESAGIRADRIRRWQVNFTVTGPEDHLKQLASLGAIVALPDAAGRYHVYRDLTRRPAVGNVEDISKIDRIWFIDSNAETATGIGRALAMRESPARLIAFFPQALEDKMASLEKGLPPRDKAMSREKTFFRVVRRADGYSVMLTEPQQ
jgi:hypothetical protein